MIPNIEETTGNERKPRAKQQGKQNDTEESNVKWPGTLTWKAAGRPGICILKVSRKVSEPLKNGCAETCCHWILKLGDPKKEWFPSSPPLTPTKREFPQKEHTRMFLHCRPRFASLRSPRWDFAPFPICVPDRNLLMQLVQNHEVAPPRLS